MAPHLKNEETRERHYREHTLCAKHSLNPICPRFLFFPLARKSVYPEAAGEKKENKRTDIGGELENKCRLRGWIILKLIPPV